MEDVECCFWKNNVIDILLYNICLCFYNVYYFDKCTKLQENFIYKAFVFTSEVLDIVLR